MPETTTGDGAMTDTATQAPVTFIDNFDSFEPRKRVREAQLRETMHRKRTSGHTSHRRKNKGDGNGKHEPVPCPHCGGNISFFVSDYKKTGGH